MSFRDDSVLFQHLRKVYEQPQGRVRRQIFRPLLLPPVPRFLESRVSRAEKNLVRDCQECIATIWCLCNKTNKLKKTKEEGHQAELNTSEKGAASGYAEDTRKTECSASDLGSRGVASGVAGGSSGRQPVTGPYWFMPVPMNWKAPGFCASSTLGGQ